MAKFTPGPAVSAVSGSIGGTTFSRNRGGQYMRRRAIPTDPASTPQLNARAILAAQSQGWADRTDAERASWENWASQNPITDVLGNSITLSGHMAYIKLNTRLAQDAQTLLTVPPIINAPAALLTLVQTADIGLGTFDLAYTATPLAAGVELWIRSALVNSAGITYVRNLFRFIGTSAAAQASPFDHEALVTARFGVPIAGQTLHTLVSTFDTATGLLSVPLDVMTVVVDT